MGAVSRRGEGLPETEVKYKVYRLPHKQGDAVPEFHTRKAARFHCKKRPQDHYEILHPDGTREVYCAGL